MQQERKNCTKLLSLSYSNIFHAYPQNLQMIKGNYFNSLFDNNNIINNNNYPPMKTLSRIVAPTANPANSPICFTQ